MATRVHPPPGSRRRWRQGRRRGAASRPRRLGRHRCWVRARSSVPIATQIDEARDRGHEHGRRGEADDDPPRCARSDRGVGVIDGSRLSALPATPVFRVAAASETARWRARSIGEAIGVATSVRHGGTPCHDAARPAARQLLDALEVPPEHSRARLLGRILREGRDDELTSSAGMVWDERRWRRDGLHQVLGDHLHHVVGDERRLKVISSKAIAPSACDVGAAVDLMYPRLSGDRYQGVPTIDPVVGRLDAFIEQGRCPAELGDGPK